MDAPPSPPKHGYFSQPSNQHASRLLASPTWREANTATSSTFLAGYYARSRLHHLSTWKAQMQDMVGQALREEGRGREHGSPDLPPNTRRVLMHIDFDAFFVTVGLRSRPELRGKPVVVCHSTSSASSASGGEQSSTSEIASCSYEARAMGVRNGMSLGQARKYCPQVQPIPYAFQEYNDTSIELYSLLLAHADAIEAVSVDEALIDVSLLLRNLEQDDDPEARTHPLHPVFAQHRQSHPKLSTPTALAQALRHEIHLRTGCSASIGIGSNILLARLATRKAKPGGVWHLTDDQALAFTAALDVDDLHGIGWHMREDLRTRYGTINVGELRAQLTESKLGAALGPKQGAKVYKKLCGLDRDRLEAQKLRQSVGANVNYAIRFQSQDEARTFVHNLCVEVVTRLKAAKLKGRQVAVNVMVRAQDAPAEAPKFLGHGICDVHHRSAPISAPGGRAVDSLELIEPKAWALIASLNADPKELRGIGVSLHKLELASGGTDGAGPSPVKPERGQQLLNFGAKKVAPVVPPVQASESTVTLPVPVPEAVSADYATSEANTAAEPQEARQAPANQLSDIVDDAEEIGRVSALAPATNVFRSKGKGKAPILGDVGPRMPSDGNNRPTTEPHPVPETSTSSESMRPPPPAADAPGPSFINVPTMSQIDPVMLLELPEWARAEVLHNAQLGRKLQQQQQHQGTKRGREAEAEEKEVDGENALLRTPQKKLMVKPGVSAGAGAGGGVFETMLRSARTPEKGKGKAKAPPSTPTSGTRTKKIATTPQSTTPRRAVIDPASMDEDEVRALGIDPAFLRALPVPIQREVIAEHLAVAAGGSGGTPRAGAQAQGQPSPTGAGMGGAVGVGANRGLLFKPGQVHKFGTRAEERREAARKAALMAVPSLPGGRSAGAAQSHRLEDQVPLLVVAKREGTTSALPPAPAPDTAVPAQPYSRPSLTTRAGDSISAPSEIRSLLSQWFAKRHTQLPRESEVRRIRDFVLACVVPGARLGSVHWDVEGALGALGWWRRLLERQWPAVGPLLDAVGTRGNDDDNGDEDGGGGQDEVARAWSAKWSEVHDEVEKRISERLCRPVRI
ncbi:deoxycytidyl transferase [Tilletia horrida]|nr:deoxycytidyl transferase [Tilletia horrida]